MTKLRVFKSKEGFSFVEALVVAVIASLCIIFMQAIFSYTVRSTMRGHDSFDSYRAATRLFNSLREDLIVSVNYEVAEEIFMDFSTNELSDTVNYSQSFIISHELATITYSFTHGDQFIQRREQRRDGTNTQRDFGVPRIQEFQVLKVNIENEISSSQSISEQLLVNLSVQSDDPRFPTARIDFSSAFFPDRREHEWVDWNFVFLDN